MCSVAKLAMCLRSVVISSSSCETSESKSSKTVIEVIHSLSVGLRRAILSASYLDMFNSSLACSVVVSRWEEVLWRRLLPCMTLFAKVLKDSCDVT